MGSLRNILSGKIGNVIFYERNGTLCIRSIARRVRQTKATKTSAVLFGKAAKINKALRSGLVDILADAKDRRIMLRLNQHLVPLLKKTELKGFHNILPAINGFQFNDETDIQNRVNIPFIIEWNKHKAVVNFSRTDLFKAFKSPKGTVATYLEMAVTGCRLADTTTTATYFTAARLTADKPGPEKIELPFQLQNGCLTIIVAALKYEIIHHKMPTIITNKKWLPVGIIGACFGKPE